MSVYVYNHIMIQSEYQLCKLHIFEHLQVYIQNLVILFRVILTSTNEFRLQSKLWRPRYQTIKQFLTLTTFTWWENDAANLTSRHRVCYVCSTFYGILKLYSLTSQRCNFKILDYSAVFNLHFGCLKDINFSHKMNWYLLYVLYS